MACEVCKKPYVPEDYDFDSDRKPHECSICGKGFSLKIQLKRHMLLHEGNVPYVCDSCERHLDDTSSSYNLRLSKKGDFSCETCGKSFTTKRSLLRHASEHTLESVLNCDECGEKFKNMTALKRHAATHKPKKRSFTIRNSSAKDEFSFTCEECGKIYSDFTEFELHCASHIKKHKCGKCNVYFNSNKVLEDHKKSCSSPEGNNSDSSAMKEDVSNSCKHVCNICTKSFTRKSALEGHMFSHYEEEENRDSPVEDDSDKDVDFKCNQKNDKPPKSDKQTSDDLTKELCLPKLKIHRPFKCEKCDVVCASKKLLKKHMVLHDIPSVEEAAHEKKKTYMCRICSEIFSAKDAYKKHKLTHRGTDEGSKEKDSLTHSCSLCEKVFSKRKHLKKHLQTHLDNNIENNSAGNKKRKRSKNFACAHCGKRFVGETCMRKHEAKHGSTSNDDSNSNNREDAIVKVRKSYTKKPKPLICEFCSEDFTGRRQVYVKHKMGHTPEVCGICDARFTDRASLREHCRIHIGTEEGRRFLECSQKALAAKNGLAQPDAKVEYIYLVLR